MRVPFRLVDVFAERPLRGNQLCVVPDATGLNEGLMLEVAREVGFSETTFVTAGGGTRYSMRIFTPAGELPFAGHPTLGTAFVLVSEGRVTSPVTQTVSAGEFGVEVDVARRHARMRQLPATFGPALARADLEQAAAALGLDPRRLLADRPAQVVSTGIGHLMVSVEDEETVRAAEPRPPALRAVLQRAGAGGCDGFALAGDGVRAKARLFVPGVGVSEDPATGSAAGPLGAFCLEHGLTASHTITISQGEEVGRPSVLEVEVEREADAWRPWVGGGVFVVGSGEFVLRDQE
jgi:trans-2,3-dihydro-3-hydroxyanthranilate isomerase